MATNNSIPSIGNPGQSNSAIIVDPEFILAAKLCKNCVTGMLLFNDTSGIYIPPMNTGGYGEETVVPEEVTSVYVDYLAPNTTVPIRVPIQLSDYMDMIAYGNQIPLTPAMFGLTTFEDGWGTFTYTIEGQHGTGDEVLATFTIPGEVELNTIFYVGGVQINDYPVIPPTPTVQELYDALALALISYGSGYVLQPFTGDAPFIIVAPPGTGSSANGLIVEIATSPLTQIGVMAGGSDHSTWTPFIYSTSQKFFWDCNTSCCVQKLLSDATNEDDCGCCEKGTKRSLAANAFLAWNFLQAAICCGNEPGATKELAKLKLYCSGKDCGCH